MLRCDDSPRPSERRHPDLPNIQSRMSSFPLQKLPVSAKEETVLFMHIEKPVPVYTTIPSILPKKHGNGSRNDPKAEVKL